MNSKKTDANKRANLPRASDFTRQFFKDWQSLSASGRFNMVRLKEAMMLLIENDCPLPPEWLDHSLTGNWRDHRECHIGGDFLLIYKIVESGKFSEIIFIRTGTHSELFS